MGKQLSLGGDFTSLFTDADRVQNPFASSSSPLKLSLVMSYNQVEKDDHGKGNMAFLDTSFDFLAFDAGELEEGDNNTPTTFTKDLRTNLVASIAINEYFEDIIENNGKDLSFFSLPSIDNSPGNDGSTSEDQLLQLCQGDCDEDDDCAAGLECFQRDEDGAKPTGCIGTPTENNDYCVMKDEGLRLGVIPYFEDISDPIQNVLVGGKFTGFLNTKTNQWITPHPTLAEPHRRFTRSFLDASIAAIFGEKTSIGQVCSFAQGLKDDNVITVPGFCCLDAPYEADYWGELVRNILLCKLKSTK
jgi:hypothetical protein